MRGMGQFSAPTLTALPDAEDVVFRSEKPPAHEELLAPPRIFSSSPPKQRRDSQTSSLLAELVKMDTALLRSQLSAQEHSRLLNREQ